MFFFLIQISYGLIRYFLVLLGLLSFFMIPALFIMSFFQPEITSREFDGYISITFVIMLCFPIISALFLWFTGAWEKFMRWSLNCRKPLKIERDRITPLFEQVRKEAQALKGDNFDKVEIFIVDDPSANAFAIGRKTVALMSGLIERYSDDEIMAVLAHEFGHLAHGDTTKSGIAYSAESGAILTERVAAQFFVLARIPFFGVVFGILLMPFVVIKYLISVFDYLLMLAARVFGRKQEFAADKFCFDLGHGDALYQFLNSLREQNTPTNGFLSILEQTHPAAGKRMLQLEELSEQT